jgi:hypothetical protein
VPCRFGQLLVSTSESKSTSWTSGCGSSVSALRSARHRLTTSVYPSSLESLGETPLGLVGAVCEETPGSRELFAKGLSAYSIERQHWLLPSHAYEILECNITNAGTTVAKANLLSRLFRRPLSVLTGSTMTNGFGELGAGDTDGIK